MSDTELNLVLSVEDQISEGAAVARDELMAIADGPYEGELNIAANLEDNASAEISALADEAEAATSSAEGTSDALREVGSAAQAASGDFDKLAVSADDAATAGSEQVGVNENASDSLNDVGNAATTADVSIRGATGGIRALTSVTKMVGGAAGVSTGALSGLSTGSRLLMMSTRLLHGGLAAVGGLLAAIPGWGWAAIGVGAALGVTWKTNGDKMRDSVMSLRIAISSSFNTMRESVGRFFTAIGAGGQRVNQYSQQQGTMNTIVRAAIAPIVGLQRVVEKFTNDLAQEGAQHNRVTAAIERAQAAEARYKTAIDSSRNAQQSYITAVRAREDAETRATTSVSSAERANLGVERALQAAGRAQKTYSDMQASGTATAEDLNAAYLDMQDANLSVKEAEQNKAQATRDGQRAHQDIKPAIENEKAALDVMNTAMEETMNATRDAKDASQELQDNLNGLQMLIANMSAAGYREFADEAVDQLNRITEAQRQIDPTLRHSPSLVDRVETGINEIMGHYKRLGDTSGVMPSVKNVPVVTAATVGAGAAPILLDLTINGSNSQDVDLRIDGKTVQIARSSSLRNKSRVKVR